MVHRDLGEWKMIKKKKEYLISWDAVLLLIPDLALLIPS